MEGMRGNQLPPGTISGHVIPTAWLKDKGEHIDFESVMAMFQQQQQSVQQTLKEQTIKLEPVQAKQPVQQPNFYDDFIFPQEQQLNYGDGLAGPWFKPCPRVVDSPSKYT